MKQAADGMLLYVTDLTSDSNEDLDHAFALAEQHGVSLEMIHVVDLAKSHSTPDAQMGIQFRLEALAQRLRHLKRNVVSLLLFGSPEEVISTRATQIRARIIAFARSHPAAAAHQAALVKRLGSKVGCPVVVLPEPVI